MIKFIFLITGIWGSPSHSPADSLRLKTIDGKLFVIHQVDPKETLYRISKRYRVPIDQILKYNNKADTGLDIGQILKIPFEKPSPRSNKKYHEVQPEETLSSIAALYGLSEGKLRALNKLTDATISVGQKLIINKSVNQIKVQPDTAPKKIPKGFHRVTPGETLYSLSNRYNTTVKNIKQWNNITGSTLSIGQVIQVYDNSSTTENNNPIKPANVKKSLAVSKFSTINSDKRDSTINKRNSSIGISEKVAGASEVNESGLVQLIEGSIAKRKYLALHPTASKGSILKIRSTSNNNEIFVRVIGPLPTAEAKGGIIIKVSKSAFDRLGGVKNPFQVEISYYK